MSNLVWPLVAALMLVLASGCQGRSLMDNGVRGQRQSDNLVHCVNAWFELACSDLLHDNREASRWRIGTCFSQPSLSDTLLLTLRRRSTAGAILTGAPAAVAEAAPTAATLMETRGIPGILASMETPGTASRTRAVVDAGRESRFPANAAILRTGSRTLIPGSGEEMVRWSRFVSNAPSPRYFRRSFSGPGNFQPHFQHRCNFCSGNSLICNRGGRSYEDGYADCIFYRADRSEVNFRCPLRDRSLNCDWDSIHPRFTNDDGGEPGRLAGGPCTWETHWRLRSVARETSQGQAIPGMNEEECELHRSQPLCPLHRLWVLLYPLAVE